METMQLWHGLLCIWIMHVPNRFRFSERPILHNSHPPDLPKLLLSSLQPHRIMNRHCSLSVLVVLLVGAFSLSLSAQPPFPTCPEKAQLICSDVELFVAAQSMMGLGADMAAILQVHYLDSGSPGLAEFLTRHPMSASQMAAAMEKHPEEYARIPQWLETIETLRAAYVTQLANYKTVIPDAMFPPTYLLVGDFKGTAQASRTGQLVTITRTLDRPEVLLNIMLHELTHFQQARKMGFQRYVGVYAQKDNMLALILREGGAEFVTHLVTGRISQTKGLAYLEVREQELKERFREDLARQDAKFWLWESLDQDKIPSLLGYVMGFKICQAYYEAASDKSAALDAILRMDNPAEFLAQSGYLETSTAPE